MPRTRSASTLTTRRGRRREFAKLVANHLHLEMAKPLLDAELGKLLCANCHKERDPLDETQSFFVFNFFDSHTCMLGVW